MSLKRGLLLGISASMLLLAPGCDDIDINPYLDDEFSRNPRPGSGPCEPDTSPDSFLLARGLLQNASRWTCNPPFDTRGRPRFTGYEGNTFVINGGSTELAIDWRAGDLDGDGQDDDSVAGLGLIVGVVDEPGYWWVPLAEDPGEPLAAEFFFNPDHATSRETLYIAFDHAGLPADVDPGEYLEIPLQVIPVRSGAIQISLSWDTNADLDLYIEEPTGNVIFFGARESATGGLLDLDSNAACGTPRRQNENASWPATAPPGEYLIRVAMWSNCEVAGSTNWRVNALVEGEVIDTWTGVMSPDAESDPDGEAVGSVVWGGPSM